MTPSRDGHRNPTFSQPKIKENVSIVTLILLQEMQLKIVN